MSKLYRARSLLYRRQMLQVNIRWKALDEIYKTYMLLHRSDLNISDFQKKSSLQIEKSTHFFFAFFDKFLQKIKIRFFIDFAQVLRKFCRNFADNLENVEFFRIFELSRGASSKNQLRKERKLPKIPEF